MAYHVVHIVVVVLVVVGDCQPGDLKYSNVVRERVRDGVIKMAKSSNAQMGVKK